MSRPNLFMVSGDTGIARGQENIFRHTLRELSQYWEHIDVCVPRTPGASAQVLFDNVHIHPSDRDKLRFPSFVREVGARVLAERSIDLVTAHSYPFFLNERGAAAVARAAGAVSVVEVMHIVGHPRASDVDEWLRRVAARFGYRRVTRAADRVRVINREEVPEFLVGRAGVDAGKLLVAPCFYLDFGVFYPPAERTFGGCDILYSGRLAKNKGLFELLDAVAMVRRQRDVRLTVLGDGELRPALERRISRLRLDDITRLLGHVPHTELGELYRQGDVLVMASKNEGGPRVTLEAMACGLPVLSTRIGIMREVMSDGENGIFIGFDADSIAAGLDRVLGNADLARRISAAAPAAVARFELKTVIRDYAEAYLELVHARRRRASRRGLGSTFTLDALPVRVES